MIPLSCIERENFLRFCLLVITNAKSVVICLLEFYLQQQQLTFEQFLQKHQHDIYHLCNARRCCKCIKNKSKLGSTQTRSILSKAQIDVLYTESLCRNNCGKTCCNILQPKQCVSPCDLDLTLAKCLLTNFCSDIFWYCCLQLRNKILQEFLDEKKHLIYHLYVASLPCCLCKSSFEFPVKSAIINKQELLVLYKSTTTSRLQSNCCSNHSIKICELSANVLSPSSIENHVAVYIQQHCCETRKALEVITEFRNKCYAHAKEAVLSDNEFETNKEKLIGAILTLADVCGMREKTKTDIDTDMKKPLDGSQMQNYQAFLMDMIAKNSKIDEMCDSLPTDIENIVNTISQDHLKQIIDTINTNFLQLSNKHEQADLSERMVASNSKKIDDCVAMTPKVEDFYIIVKNLSSFLHEEEACDIKNDGEIATSLIKYLFENLNKSDSENFSTYQITEIFDIIEKTDETTRKLNKAIERLKINLKRRDFRKFMVYVNVCLCLGVIRKEVLIQISKRMTSWSKFETQIKEYSKSVHALCQRERAEDETLLSIFVSTSIKSAVVNFMYNACDWLFVDRILASSDLLEDSPNLSSDSVFTIECAAFIGSKAYMTNLFGSFLRWSNDENLQSRFKFTQTIIAGKPFFTIHSCLWPKYHVKMHGMYSDRCVCGKHGDLHDSGTWSIRGVKYSDETFYLLAPRKSRAAFMCADISGRIYGSLCQVDTYCLWSIKQVTQENRGST